jgi:D-lactate dehydrogenase
MKNHLTVSFYDAKSYDQKAFSNASRSEESIAWRFHDFRLNAETAASAHGAQVACVFVNDRVDAECLAVLSQLGVRLVALRCAGFNNVDLTAAKALGIPVVRVPAYSPHAVAEHTVALLLTLNRQIHRAFNRVRDLNFSLHGLVGFDVFGKTVGIIGTGQIGRVTAELFRGFGVRLLGHDPAPHADWADTCGLRYVSLDELLLQSDIVTLHLPLTPQSRYLINAQTVARMKRGAFLVNTSRGKLIDTTALIDALKTGQLGGVALDVYEEEEGLFFEDHSGRPLQDDELSRLLTFPNVLITAHQAFLTHEALSQIAQTTLENIRNLQNGQPWKAGTAL